MTTEDEGDRSGCPKLTGPHDKWAVRRGCTCPDARAARNKWEREYKAGRRRTGYVPAIGTVRRLRALAADGWPSVELARRLGVSQQMVSYLRNPVGKTVRWDNALRVSRLFDQLEGRPGPSEWTRSRAVMYGWPPSMAWMYRDMDDVKARAQRGSNPRNPGQSEVLESNLDDVIAGREHLYTLPVRYRLDVVERMVRWGLSPNQISERLDVEVRTVERYKAGIKARAQAGQLAEAG